MKHKLSVLAITVFNLFLLPVNNVYSQTLQIPYVQEGACPFEGCAYGKWDVLKDASVYEKPDTNSKVIGAIRNGGKVNALTGNVYIIPGRAIVVGEPHRSAKDLDPNKAIFILDYVGEGYSRVFQDGIFAEIKIARTKARCKENPSWRYCWARVVEEPVSFWWVLIETNDKKLKGWVLMEGEVLKPIDLFS